MVLYYTEMTNTLLRIMKKTQNKQVGKWGEEKAALFLLEKGYNIIAKNFSTRFAEIDIIAWHKKQHFGKTLCFIEVKTRSKKDGSAERAVNKQKLSHMYKGAYAFCLKKQICIDATPIQFEHVSIYKNKMKQEPDIVHYIIPTI
tara:strand:- start:1895 stop:2326 length:432 start_codon:yes stop_codon:yes gene_type:complete